MRLLLIEDHAMIRQGLGLLLRQLYPEIVVREAATAREGLQLLGDAVRYVLAGTVILVVGVLLGFRPEAGVTGAVAALGLVVLFAFALSWAFSTLGLLLRSPNAVMNAGFMGIFPLTFLSNVFVPPETLPSVLEAFVDVNPISLLATASRGLMAGDVQASEITVVLAVAVALTAVFAPLTTLLYRRS